MTDLLGGLEHEGDENASVDDALERAIERGGLPPLYRRAWLLVLVQAAERFGITPLAQGDVHALAFLANALAPVYELLAPDRAVLKSPDGPFFSEVQWDLDRLSTQGLLERRQQPNQAEDLAQYACTRRGLSLATGALTSSPLLNASYGYLHEVVSAFSEADGTMRQSTIAADATLSTPSPFGTVIDYGEWDNADERNFSLRTTTAFESGNPRGVRFSPQDRLHLYVRYLQRARERLAS